MKVNLNTLERKLPLENFIPAAFFIFMVCTLVMSIITYRTIGNYQKEMSSIEYGYKIIGESERLQVEINYWLYLRRGLVLSGDQNIAGEIDKQKAVVDSVISLLTTTVADNPGHRETIDSIKANVVDLNGIVELSKKNFNDKEQLKILEEEHTVKMRIKISNIKRLSDAIVLDERRILDSNRIDATKSNNDVQLIIIILSLFSFLVIGLSLLISNGLIRHKSEVQKMLVKSYQGLEDKVEARTIELKNANDKLLEEIAIREKAESVLRESESRFRSLADSAPVMIWVSGKDKMCTYINKGWLDFTGRTFEQEIGKRWNECIHPKDFGECLRVYETSFDKRQPYELNYRLRAADGEYRWIFERGIPRFDGDNFAGYIGSCIDIDKLQKNERYLRLQFNVSRILADAKTKAEGIGRALEEICKGIDWGFGVLWSLTDDNEHLPVESVWINEGMDINQESVFLKRFSEFPKEAGLPGIVLKNKKSVWVSDILNDERFIRKEELISNGWNSALAIPILTENKIIAIVECLNEEKLKQEPELVEVLESAGRQIGNFMERKSAEEKLQNSYQEMEQKVIDRTADLANALNNLLKEAKEKETAQNRIKLFAHAIRSINECVYITDLNDNVLFVNEAFEKTFGFASDEIMGKNIPLFDEGKILLELKTDIANKTMKGGWKGEFAASDSGGNEVHTFLSTSTILDEEDKVQAIVGICQDISELKRAEELITKRNFLLNLLNEVIHYTNQSFDIHKSIQYSIDKICKYTNWNMGHCFLRKGDMIYSAGISNHTISSKYTDFIKFTKDITFSKGEGVPGNILVTGKASWLNISNIENRKAYKRSEIFMQSGLKTGIWIPIIKENKVAGILEFFKDTEDAPDNEILECVSNIGIELGSLMEKMDTIDRLKENEGNLQEAQHIGKLGSWDYDVRKNVVSWTDELFIIYEVNATEFKPSLENFLERVHPDDRQRVKKIIENAFIEKKRFDYIHRIITTSGQVKTIKAMGKVYLDDRGDVVRMFGTGQDITDIRKAEDDLRLSEAKLREAQHIAKLGSWDWDLSSNILEWSDELYSIFGIEKNGKPLSQETFLEIVHPDDRNFVRESTRKMLKEKKPSDVIFRIFTKDAGIKFIRLMSNIVFDKTNHIERISGVSIDVTDIKSVEEELRSTNKKLIQTQKELINNEKLAALGRFSSGIAHEIRNPLANISSLAQLVLNTELDEKNRKRLKYVLANSDIANQIIKNLLSFVSPEDLILKTTGIRNMLEVVIESIEARCKQKQITIVKNIQNDLPELKIDKLRLENALMNFISNAIDAMSAGGTLTISAFVNNEGSMEIDINDTGEGIPSENFDKILEPFFTTKPEGVGLGMGLAHNTIRAHSGTLDIESITGEGTRIKIILPINENN